MRQIIKHLELGILELLLGLLIIAGLVGYVVPLPAEVEWLDHMVSFVLFTVMFYQVNVTEIIIGKKYHGADAFIMIGFFSLFFKDMMAVTQDLAGHFHLVESLNSLAVFIADNRLDIDLYFVYVGIALLLIVSLWLTKNATVLDASMLYALTHERTQQNSIWRFTLIFLVLLAFYFFVFNMVLEWLEFTLDDPIIFLGIVYYITLLAKHREKFDKEHFVFQIGEIVDTLYKKFVLLFHYKHTLPLAISGILILHALADLSVFAYGYTIDKENIYLAELRAHDESSHHSFFELFIKDSRFSAEGFSWLIGYLHFFNALALMILLAIPAVTWFFIFTHRNFHLSRWMLIIIFTSFFAFLSMPTFSIESIHESSGTRGVDIQTHQLFFSQGVASLITDDQKSKIITAVLLSLLGGLIAWVVSIFDRGKKELYAATLAGGLVFYGFYLFTFYKSLLVYLFGAIIGIYVNGLLFSVYTPLAIVFWLFFLLATAFYLGGFALFLYEIYAEYRDQKWSEPQEKTQDVIEHVHARMEDPAHPSQAELHH